MTIRTRFFLAFLAVAAISGLAAIFSLASYERQLATNAGRSSAALARSLIDTIDRDIFNRIETLSALVTTSPEIASLLDQSNQDFAALGSAETIEALLTVRDLEWPQAAEAATLAAEITSDPVSDRLRTFRAFFEDRYGYQVFGEIFVTNRYGANVAQTALTSDYRQDDELWWQNAAALGLSIGDVQFDDSAGIYAIQLAVRIQDFGGETQGIAKAVLNIEDVQTILERFRADSKFSTIDIQVLDGIGQPFLRSDEQSPLAELELPVEGDSEDGFAIITNRTDGRDWLVAGAQSRGFSGFPWLPWTARVAVETSELLASVATMRTTIVIVGLISLVIIAVTSAAVALTLSRPIHDLVVIAERLARGELSIELGSSSASGEIGTLTRAMKAMLANLREAVGRMIGSAAEVSDAANRLVTVGREIASGAQEQSAASDETSSAIEEMAASIQEVATSSERVVDTLVDASQSIEEMGVSIHSVAGRSHDLSDGVDHTLSTMRDMVTSIEAVAPNAARAREASSGAVAEAAGGEATVRETVDGMQRMSDSMSDVVSVVQNLDAASRQITQVTQVIEDIAGQSHLLAVNATVQAAHAGEHGRSFAVVADEVGHLAERSASATQEIGTILSDVREQIDKAIEVSEIGSKNAAAGVELAHRAGDALDRIASSIGGVSSMMTEVTDATERQADATEQVVATFETMRLLTQEVEETTRQQAATSGAISQSIEVMQAMALEVSTAASEQSRGSEQVVRSMAEIARISNRNAETASAIVDVSQELERQSNELNRVSNFFFVSRAPIDQKMATES